MQSGLVLVIGMKSRIHETDSEYQEDEAGNLQEEDVRHARGAFHYCPAALYNAFCQAVSLQCSRGNRRSLPFAGQTSIEQTKACSDRSRGRARPLLCFSIGHLLNFTNLQGSLS